VNPVKKAIFISAVFFGLSLALAAVICAANGMAQDFERFSNASLDSSGIVPSRYTDISIIKTNGNKGLLMASMVDDYADISASIPVSGAYDRNGSAMLIYVDVSHWIQDTELGCGLSLAVSLNTGGGQYRLKQGQDSGVSAYVQNSRGKFVAIPELKTRNNLRADPDAAPFDANYAGYIKITYDSFALEQQTFEPGLLANVDSVTVSIIGDQSSSQSKLIVDNIILGESYDFVPYFELTPSPPSPPESPAPPENTTKKAAKRGGEKSPEKPPKTTVAPRTYIAATRPSYTQSAGDDSNGQYDPDSPYTPGSPYNQGPAAPGRTPAARPHTTTAAGAPGEAPAAPAENVTLPTPYQAGETLELQSQKSGSSAVAFAVPVVLLVGALLYLALSPRMKIEIKWKKAEETEKPEEPDAD